MGYHLRTRSRSFRHEYMKISANYYHAGAVVSVSLEIFLSSHFETRDEKKITHLNHLTVSRSRTRAQCDTIRGNKDHC